MGVRASLREVKSADLAKHRDPAGLLQPGGHSKGEIVSLEKSWHGMNELLTAAGEAEELGFLLDGGIPLAPGGADEDEDGDDPPRLLDPAFVARLNAALAAISDDDYWAGYDAEAFEENSIYPGIWDEDPEDLREEYVSYLEQVRTLVARVAAEGGGIIVTIG